MSKKKTTQSIIKDVQRKTRRKFSAEEKIRIVLEGLRGEESISEICRKESIHPNQYYKWSKDFMEAAKKRMSGDTLREAGSDEVKELRNENDELKKLVAELSLKNKVLKKSLNYLE
jgi:transposase